MKKHTLSLAIVGTLASSLVLSQAVLAEEVETSTESTSSEEVMSDESVAESVADETSAEAVSESEGSRNSSDEGEAPTTPEAVSNFYKLYNKVENLQDYSTFFTEESLASLGNIVEKYKSYSSNTDTELLNAAAEDMHTVIQNLQNNYNVAKPVDELDTKEAWERLDGSYENFTLKVLRFDLYKTYRTYEQLLPENDALLSFLWKASYGYDVVPIKEDIVAASKKITATIDHAKKSYIFSEDSQEFRDIQSLINAVKTADQLRYSKSYTPESLAVVNHFLDKAEDFVREKNFNAIETVRKHLTDLNNAIQQLVENPEKTATTPNSREIKDSIDVYRHYVFQEALTKDSFAELKKTAEAANELDPSLFNKVLAEHEMKYFTSIKADKEIIDLEKDTEITLTAKLKPGVKFSELDIKTMFPDSLRVRDTYTFTGEPQNITVTQTESGELTIKIPLPHYTKYFSVFAPYIILKEPDGNGWFDRKYSLPVYIPVKGYSVAEKGNVVTSTAINKKEVTHGENLVFNAQFAFAEENSLHVFNIYRVGENTPFKTIRATNRPKVVTTNGQTPYFDEIYSIVPITAEFSPGEYEIREGNLLGTYNPFGGYADADDTQTYSVPEKFYQRFTVKAKAQAETEKKEDSKSEEQPKVDNTKPVEDKKTEEQPKVDNTTPDVKPSDNKKDEPSQPENKPSDNKKDEQPQVDHKPDNTTPEVKPSVDVKPMDMPKGDEKKDKVKEVKEEKTEVTTPSTSAPSTPTATPSKPASSAQALPETGELDSLFGLSALAILASVGLVAPAIRRREQ